MTPSRHNTPNLQAALLGLHNRISASERQQAKEQARVQPLREEREAIIAELLSRGVKPRVYSPAP
jgi:hypothetical protein